jgi:hypothetical protein
VKIINNLAILLEKTKKILRTIEISILRKKNSAEKAKQKKTGQNYGYS